MTYIATLKKGTRITWRTLLGTYTGTITDFSESHGCYFAQADKMARYNAMVWPQDIIRIYA